jgi:hypothetical protein
MIDDQSQIGGRRTEPTIAIGPTMPDFLDTAPRDGADVLEHVSTYLNLGGIPARLEF